MQGIEKTKKELESLIADEGLSMAERAKAQSMLDEGDYLEEGATVTRKKIRASLEKHKEMLDYLAKH